MTMVRRTIYVALLPLWLMAVGQTTDQDKAHAIEWKERHARYSDLRIVESESWLEINVNSPRPLNDVLAALANSHVWRINYEDPHYGHADLVDDTAPSWLKEHPNGTHVYGIAGGALSVKFPLDGYFPDDPMQVIPAVIEAYNRSGNPGRFELRTTEKHEWFDVVPTAAADGPQEPILDTVMSFDATETDDFMVTLRRFCEELASRGGQAIEFWGFFQPGSNPLEQAKIKLHAHNEPAREILRQMLGQVSSTATWLVLFDADSQNFTLKFR
jgi:hypothetical protein